MRLPSPRLSFCCILCIAAAARALPQTAAAPQETPTSVDELFANPQGDTEATTSDAKQLLAPFHAEPLSVAGSLETMAGGVIGFSDKADATGSNGPYKLKVSPGMSFVPVMTFSARPDETVRFQGTASFPFQSSSTFAPTINEVFIDYTLQDKIYMRIGKHLVSWGVTRIFDVPDGDLMADSNDSTNYLNIKMTVPIHSGGITGIVLSPPSIFDASPSWKEIIYGLQADVPIYHSELILSGSCYGDNTCADAFTQPLNATAVFKTSFLGADLFSEGVWASNLDTSAGNGSSIRPIFTGWVSGFYRDWADHVLTLYGEYYIDATDTTWRSQYTSVVAKMDKVFGSSFDLALQWTNAYRDSSGIITPGFSADILPHIKMQIGFPCRYGKPGSYYLTQQSPEVQTAVVPTTQLSWLQRYGFLLRLTMSMNF